MKAAALKTSLNLSLLFVLVYGVTNWLSSLRHNVPSFTFAWERHISFVPLLILPYMSIDLFFVAAPFLCDDRERRALARRITAAILIAGACFLLFPLRFSFDRPHVDDLLGAIFNNFRAVDRPFNEFPSLHIALCLILADLYARHTSGVLRSALLVWFLLIFLSPVLTYQHHVIDVIGGAILAAVCFHLFQSNPLRQPTTGNRRVGTYYLIAAVLLAIDAFLFPPWTCLLILPAGASLLVAAGYYRLGPGIYRKYNGRLPLTTWLILWPMLLGQKLSLIYYAGRCRPWDRLIDRLWIGRKLTNREARRAITAGVTAVLDLTAEFSETPALLAIPYLQIPILDLTAPTPAQIDQAVEWIIRQSAKGIVYIHCKAGYSRTAAIAGAFLLRSGLADTPEQATRMLHAARPTIIIRPEAADVLLNCGGRERATPQLTTA